MKRLCECGCRQEVNNRFVRGHNGRGIPKSEEHNRKNALAQIGRKLSEEVKEKIRLKAIGRRPGDKTKAKMKQSREKYIATPEGKAQILTWIEAGQATAHTLEARLKKSGTCKGRSHPHAPWSRRCTPEECKRFSDIAKSRVGDKNGNWKGGKSFEPYTPAFNGQLKEFIRERDGYRCQLCGVPQAEYNKKLSVHHIDYDKTNCLPSNLISLCNSCNGKANSNRQYWQSYFTAEEAFKAVGLEYRR